MNIFLCLSEYRLEIFKQSEAVKIIKLIIDVRSEKGHLPYFTDKLMTSDCFCQDLYF